MKRGWRALSWSASRSSATRFARLASDTKVPGQSRSWIISFDRALGRCAMRRSAPPGGRRGSHGCRRTLDGSGSPGLRGQVPRRRQRNALSAAEERPSGLDPDLREPSCRPAGCLEAVALGVGAEAGGTSLHDSRDSRAAFRHPPGRTLRRRTRGQHRRAGRREASRRRRGRAGPVGRLRQSERPGAAGSGEKHLVRPDGSPESRIPPRSDRQGGRAARPERPKGPDPRVAGYCPSVNRRLGFLFAAATVAALALAPSPVAAQAFTLPQGVGAVTLAWQYVDNTGHRLSDGFLVERGQSVTMSADFELDYGVTDRLSATFGIPYVFAKYTGALPPPSNLPVDACRCWHSTFQDFSLAARYHLGDDRWAVTPLVRYTRPSHDYRYQ